MGLAKFWAAWPQRLNQWRCGICAQLARNSAAGVVDACQPGVTKRRNKDRARCPVIFRTAHPVRLPQLCCISLACNAAETVSGSANVYHMHGISRNPSFMWLLLLARFAMSSLASRLIFGRCCCTPCSSHRRAPSAAVFALQRVHASCSDRECFRPFCCRCCRCLLAFAATIQHVSKFISHEQQGVIARLHHRLLRRILIDARRPSLCERPS